MAVDRVVLGSKLQSLLSADQSRLTGHRGRYIRNAVCQIRRGRIAGSGDPAYNDAVLASVGRVPPRGVLPPALALPPAGIGVASGPERHIGPDAEDDSKGNSPGKDRRDADRVRPDY
jgi:hypothetical protein